MASAEEFDSDEVSFEPYVLASYAGKPWYPGGVRLCAQTQCVVAELMCDAYGGRYRRSTYVRISMQDKDIFEKQASIRADTYGELTPDGFLEILWRVGAKRGDRFYDLGAGTGKLATLAWLLGLRSTGIELSNARWVAGCEAMTLLEASGAGPRLPVGKGRPSCLPPVGDSLDLICGSMFDLDFTDADIIFVSTVMFSLDMILQVARHARLLKPGARIISAHDLSHPVPSEKFPEFEEIGECNLASSWNDNSKWYVHEIADNSCHAESPTGNRTSAAQFSSSQRRVCQCSNDTFYLVVN